MLQKSLSGSSIVYNFRIAQITKQPIFERSRDRHHTVIALPFEQYSKKYNGIKQNYAGALAAYIYEIASYYFRTDIAVSSIFEKVDHTTTFSGSAMDDILFTVGKNFLINNRTEATLSGLFGIPTHNINTLRHPDFGYGQVGTGIQFDGLYVCNHTSHFIYGVRYIYFVPRNAYDSFCEKRKFTIGNVADLLVASKNVWGHQGFEFGYTARFNFGARACPDFDDIARKTNYIRSNFYAVYKYKFLINNIPNRFLFNISYGFDHTPKKYGNKYIITLWTSWNVNF